LSTSAQSRINYADWRLEWAEEFNAPLDTTALAERWRFAYPWSRIRSSYMESSYYTAQELHTADGVLHMTAHRQANPPTYEGRPVNYTTPMLFSRHFNDSLRTATCSMDDGFSYGLFEVRVRQPHSTDMAPGFWLWGGVPDEIDVFEGNATTITNNFHVAGGGFWRPTRRGQEECQCLFYNADPAGDLSQQYHTYGVSWLPNEVIFYFDGLPIRRETRLVPAGCPMNVIVNLTAYAWANVAADTLAVDYVRIYRPRKLPYVPPVLRPGGNGPNVELMWLPAEVQPGRLDQGTHQTWTLAPKRQAPARLGLLLTDNYNPPCNQLISLPVAGEWAPAWTQTAGTPELRIQLAAPDSLHWAVYSPLSDQPIARGTTAGGITWHPRWPTLPPGTYGLHLQQGGVTITQPLSIIGRPAGSGPTAEWQVPAPEVPEPE
jgi:beta-glucanase (GH16 family)